MMLRRKIGATIKIPAWASKPRKRLEREGFVIVHRALQYETMRRDFHAGFFKAPKPEYARSAEEFIQVLNA